jgi:hypothetical protein
LGQLVLAAKVTHVPSLMLSEAEGSPLRAARAGAVGALRELGRRARERDVSTFVVFDTHWLSNSATTSTPIHGIAKALPSSSATIFPPAAAARSMSSFTSAREALPWSDYRD